MTLATWRPDFYSAAASIIPVLLISIALQERYFRTLYRLLGGRTKSTGRPYLARRVVAVLASLSFLGGGVAELLALRSLWYGHDYFGWFVFFMIAVLLGPNIIGLSMAVLGKLDPPSATTSLGDDDDG